MASGLTPESEVVVHDAGVDAVLVEHDGVPVLMLRPDMSFQAAVQAVRGVAPHLSADDAAGIVRRALPHAVDLNQLLAPSDGGCSCSGKDAAEAAAAGLAMPSLGRLGRRWARRVAAGTTAAALAVVVGGFAAKTHEAAQERDSLATQLASVHENLKTIRDTQVKNRQTLTGLASVGARRANPDASVPVSAKEKARKHRAAVRKARRQAERGGTLAAKTGTHAGVPGESVVVNPPTTVPTTAPKIDVEEPTRALEVKPPKPVKPVPAVTPTHPVKEVEEVVKDAGEVLDETVTATTGTATGAVEGTTDVLGDVVQGTGLLPRR